MTYVLSGTEDAGLGPSIKGDPTIALLAQLNRFAGKLLTPGDGCTRELNFLSKPTYPLVASALDLRAATAAVVILYHRYYCSPTGFFDKGKALWANSGLLDPIRFVNANMSTIVPTIAQFGDKLGLEPAVVGITERDPRFTPSFPIKTAALLGVFAVAAIVVTQRRR